MMEKWTVGILLFLSNFVLSRAGSHMDCGLMPVKKDPTKYNVRLWGMSLMRSCKGGQTFDHKACTCVGSPTNIQKTTAVCDMAPNQAIPVADQQPVSGVIWIVQYGPEALLEIEMDLRGIDASSPDTSRGMHIHDLSDISRDCQDAGPHFDPTGVMGGQGQGHGQQKPLGDLPPQEVEPDGSIRSLFAKRGLTMYGKRGVVDRSIVMHGARVRAADGSMKAPKIGCCVIRDN